MILVGDLGGDKFTLANYEKESGNLKSRPEAVTHPKSMKELAEILDPYIGSGQYEGASLTIAGVIKDYQLVERSPNLRWLDGINLRQWAKKIWDILLAACNDMIGAGEGEDAAGAIKEAVFALFDTFSTGWGGILKFGGGLFPGEPGHALVANLVLGQHRLCGCGKWDCREAHCSGGAVRKIVKGLFPDDLVSNCFFYKIDPCAFLDQQAEKEEPWALDLYEQIAVNIGEAWAAELNRISAIERIVYMGKFAVCGMPFMLPTIQETMQKRLMFPHHKEAIKEEIKSEGTQHLIFRSQTWPNGALIGAGHIFERIKNNVL